MSYTSQRKSSGFSLIELLITLGILIITLTIALPGFREFFDRERLINATEQVYGVLQKARMESMARSEEMSVKFNSGSWSYGPTPENVEDWELCDPTTQDPTLAEETCMISVVDHETHPEITFEAGEGEMFTFDPIRGLATSSSDGVILESGLGKKLKIEVSALGNISICSPNDPDDPNGQIPSYRDC
jgi:type IV fimbrial biogenesis protein FimT